MSRKYVSEPELQRLRCLDLAKVLVYSGIDLKTDPSYKPRLLANSNRWHVSVGAHVYELIVTDGHWFDTRAGKGGFGAIDLLMHLRGIGFLEAVRLLQKT